MKIITRALVSFTFAFFLFSNESFAQDSVTKPALVDSTQAHSPKLATIMSAVVPGAGQVYNSIGRDVKWWKSPALKVPFIYGGFAALAVYTGTYNGYYKQYKNAYDLLVANKDTSVVVYGFKYTYAERSYAQARRDISRRQRDLGYIGISVWYLLNVIDANVGAHFFNYDVGDDLSIRFNPTYRNDNLTLCLNLTF